MQLYLPYLDHEIPSTTLGGYGSLLCVYQTQALRLLGIVCPLFVFVNLLLMASGRQDIVAHNPVWIVEAHYDNLEKGDVTGVHTMSSRSSPFRMILAIGTTVFDETTPLRQRDRQQDRCTFLRSFNAVFGLKSSPKWLFLGLSRRKQDLFCLSIQWNGSREGTKGKIEVESPSKY